MSNKTFKNVSQKSQIYNWRESRRFQAFGNHTTNYNILQVPYCSWVEAVEQLKMNLMSDDLQTLRVANGITEWAQKPFVRTGETDLINVWELLKV